MQTSLATVTRSVPDWVPNSYKGELALNGCKIAKLPQVIRRRLRSPEKIKVSDHALKYRRVADGPHAGPWRHEHAPHTVKIMDTFGLPHVREVWFCGVEQSGKTNTMLNCMGWCIDCDPGNIFYLMPTENASTKITSEKIIPMIEESTRLSRYLTGRQDDLSLSKIKLNHGMNIYPAHANSAASMATFVAKSCFGDEVDKGQELVGREADRITLIRKRNRLYKGRYKRFFSSTPAGLFIWKGVMSCPQVLEFRVRCPDCNNLIEMDGDHLVLEDDATVTSIETIGEVEYACNSCGVQWDEQQRELAIRSGHWVYIKGAELKRASRVGFHHRAWECLDVPLLEIAVAWLKQKAGSQGDKIAWANGYESKDYEFEQQDRVEDYVLRLVDKSMPRKTVPRDVSMLILLVDTQRIGFFYQVWAYGYGRDLETWRIDHGYVQSFSNLKDISMKEWDGADEKKHRIQVAFIDSGGGTNPNNPKHSRTAEVYEFCRRNPVFKPLKGRRTMDLPWNVTRLDYFPGPKGKKIPIPGGLMLYKINVTIFKNELAGKLMIEPDDPGAFHLHADMGPDYAKQMCAEYQDDHGWWICPKGKDNHHWDIGVYGLAAADIVGIKNLPSPGEARPGRKIYSKGVQRG